MLPLPQLARRPQGEDGVKGPPPAPSFPLLLIEDNQDLRDLLVEVIEAQGIQVRAASDGIEGLKLLRAGLRPKAVFLDGWMPGLDGAGVLSAMTGDVRLANIPVVWMSGDVAGPPRDVSACLEKPFSVDDLLDVVRSLYETE